MKIPVYINNIILRLEKNGFSAFIVGGCVRDLLLGFYPKDWDICTAASPDDMAEIFKDMTIIPTGIKHGTITVLSSEGTAEITTFRSEGNYCDKRHPQSVTFLNDVADDLKRRDFTINAMAYSDRTGIIDLFDGQKDLKERILRCVGNPQKRFSEDALRILRALRFAAVYNLTIEKTAVDFIHKFRTNLFSVSAERIWSEVNKILTAKTPGKLLYNYQDIFAVIFSEESESFMSNPTVWKHCMDIIDLLPADSSLRLSAMLYYIKLSDSSLTNNEYFIRCTKILNRLKIDCKTRKHILNIIKMQDKPLPYSLPDARRLFGKVGDTLYNEILIWNKAIGNSEKKSFINAEKYYEQIKKYKLCCTLSELAIDGTDLINAGMKPGKEIGVALNNVLSLVIDDKLPNEKNFLLNFLFSQI